MGESDPADQATQMALSLAQAVDSLGLFLCSTAMRTLGPDELDRALKHVVQDHLPVLLQAIPCRADLAARPNLARRIVAGLEADGRTIQGLADRGLDRDSPREMKALRQAFRNLLAGLGVPLPAEAEGHCDLHGAACPLPEQGG